jgi:predicted nucleotidyltransferase
MKKKEALALASKFKQELRKSGVPFTSVIVFGSVARGEMHEQSDIDIAVVGTSFMDDRMQETLEVCRARRPVSYKIQPIWMYPENLENKYSTLAQEIKKNGMEI